MSEKRERLFSKDYILIMLAAMGAAFVNYFFISSLSPYITRLTGSAFNAGLMTTVFSIAALVIRPFAGVLSDKSGRVKLLVAGAFISAMTCLGFALTSVFWLLLIFRALNGIGFGIHSTCAGAVVADVVPKSRLSEGIGYFGTYGTIGQMAAPSIALAIIGSQTDAEYKVLFYTALGLSLFAMICDAFLSYERRRRRAGLPLHGGEEETQSESDAAGAAEPLPKALFGFEYAVFAPLAVMILMYFGLASIISHITLFVEWNWSGAENASAGLFFTFSAIGLLASRLIFSRISNKCSADVVIIPGLAVMAAGIAAIPFVGSMLQLTILSVPIGLAQGVVFPAFNSMLFMRCSVARRGTASGTFFAAIDIGYAIGAPLLGRIADLLDYRYIYWVAAVFIVLALALYMLIASDKRYNARRIKNAGKA